MIALPGGFRAWPLRGYWTNDEKSGIVRRCLAPASERCLGWSIHMKQAVCGYGYSPGTPLCGGCLPNFHEQDGACVPCPSEEATVRFAVVPILILGAVAVFLLLATTLCLRVLFKRWRVKASMLRMFNLPLDLLVWSFFTMQLVAQVGRKSSPGLPAPVRHGLSIIQLVQFDVSGVAPAECSALDKQQHFSRFWMVTAVAGASITLWMLFTCCSRCIQKGGSRAVVNWLRHASLSLVVVAYPLIINTSWAAVQCRSASGDKPGTSVLVWVGDPRVQCYSGDSMYAQIAAWIMLAVAGITLPILLLLVGRRFALQAVRNLRSSRVKSLTHSNNCSFKWCSIAQPQHRELRKIRPWATIFGFGQAWFRPAFLFHYFMISAIQFLDVYADSWVIRAVLLTAILGVILCFAGLVFLKQPDHEWGEWHRYPRFGVAIVTAFLTGFQLSQVIFLADAGVGDLPLTRLPEAPVAYSHDLPAASQVLMWASVVGACALPFLVVVAFARFIVALRKNQDLIEPTEKRRKRSFANPLFKSLPMQALQVQSKSTPKPRRGRNQIPPTALATVNPIHMLRPLTSKPI